LYSTTVNTSGNIRFDGALILYSDQTVTSSAGVVTFTGTVNSDASATPRSLTVNAGTGSVVLGGAVGGTNALSKLTASGDAGISINGNITTVTGLADGLLFEAFDVFLGDNLSTFATATRQNVKTSDISGAP
jgi:hypothetical protein